MKYKIFANLVLCFLLLTFFCQDKFYYGFLIFLEVVIANIILYKYCDSIGLFNVDNKKNIWVYFFGFTSFLWIHINFVKKPQIYGNGFLIESIYEKKTLTKWRSPSYFLVYDYKDKNSEIKHAYINVASDKYEKYPICDTSGIIKAILYVTEKDVFLYRDDSLSKQDIEKYMYPVECINRDVELGNDSYEYAKYERDIAYKYYGFNIVQIGIPIDRSKISVTKLDGSKFTMLKTNNLTDTFLVYSNINPKFYDGWHICPDSLCTSENFDKVMDGGYGYLFRGKIYSKEETEKYWNIIEQYKLRLNTNEN